MKNKLFNIMLPICILIIITAMGIYIIPVNFILNSIVLLFSLAILKISSKLEIYKKTIFKVFIFGFLVNIVGSIILCATPLLSSLNGIFGEITKFAVWNFYKNISDYIFIGIVVVVSGICTYLLNYKISFKKIEIDKKKKKVIAIIIAVFTAPYLFLYSSYLIDNYNQVIEKNIEKNIKIGYSVYEGDTVVSRIFAESQNYISSDFIYGNKLKKVESKILTDTNKPIVNMYISVDFTDSDMEQYRMWAKKCSLIVFIKKSDISQISINLEDTNNSKNITKLTFKKDEFEKEFNIKISELLENSEKLAEILSKIK
ncbi:MAG: hypothetical protein RSA08_02870 [Clostridia bacterium]